jgi:hypothetical protein
MAKILQSKFTSGYVRTIKVIPVYEIDKKLIKDLIKTLKKKYKKFVPVMLI